MSKSITVTLPYTPRPLQKYISDNLRQYSVLVMHRRFGKSYMLVYEIIKRALTFNKLDPLTSKPLKNPQFFFVSPEKAQTKRNVWTYFVEALSNFPGVHFNNNELVITISIGKLGNAKIYLEGADNPNRLRGVYVDGVVLDEYSQMPAALWDEVVSPALTDRGGWAIFSGTPQGKNKFYDLFKYAEQDDEWYSAIFKASETGYLPQKFLDERRRSMPSSSYAQEYECSFDAGMKGSYFKDAFEYLDAENRINDDISHKPSRICYTAWDLGMNDKTCIWFIEQGEEAWHVIDYYENSGKDLTHYAKVVKGKPYVYEKHILPHDAAQTSLSTGLTRKQLLTKLGLKCKVANRSGILDGINAAITVLYKCKFNSIKCKKGIEALRSYRAEYNDKLEVYKPTPLHDWASHAADAFRTFATGVRKKDPRKRRGQPGLQYDYDPLSRQLTINTDYNPLD